MYGVIRKYRVSDVDELARRVQNEFIPLVSGVPGFKAYYVLDAGDGTAASITICEDKAGVDASTDRAKEWVAERVASLIESGPEVTAGELVVEHAT
jgi:hypothetical protein